jgi:hypothetical protein
MKHDLRCALRTVLSHRWFSAAVVATLALGIGLNTMVFTLINAVLFKPVPLPGGARLISITGQKLNDNDTGRSISYPDFLEYRAQSRSYESFEATNDEPGVLSEPGNPPQSYQLLRASAGIFSMLHTSAILGRGFQPSDELPTASPSVVIAYDVWQDRYGRAASVIGRTVRVNGKPATIIGVMPNGFRFPTGVDLWMPLVPTPDMEKRDSRPILPYAILKPGASIRQGAV